MEFLDEIVCGQLKSLEMKEFEKRVFLGGYFIVMKMVTHAGNWEIELVVR